MEEVNKNIELNDTNKKLHISDVSDSNWKKKFWLPYVAGFLIILGEKTYLDSDFYKNRYFSVGVTTCLFILYHCFFVVMSFILIYYY